MKIGAQFYTIRDYCTNLEDFSESLRKVKEIGYDYVQISGVCSYEPEWLKEQLEKYGVGLIALRCAGYNNVDLKAASGRVTVVRVPAYSPYAIAEHTMGMILMLNRKLHRAYIRTRDHNFSLEGLIGFDLKDKTVGIIGTGKIGKCFADVCC